MFVMLLAVCFDSSASHCVAFQIVRRFYSTSRPE
jgi:hypothetical protein